ncbi:MAG: hypothetical protein MUQ64_09885 [Paracoccaceae bacterium]|nr:hypothetical protein [Paracoccaceae bacterium]
MNNKPTSTTVIEPTEIAVTQTIIRAENGDVIVADETGLRMRLSDRVIEDIAMRLGKSGHGFGAMPQRDDTNNFLGDVDPSSQAEELSYFIGENIDCWDILIPWENGYNERFNGTRGPHFMLQWRYAEVF